MTTLLSLSYIIDTNHLSSLFDNKPLIYLWESNFAQSKITNKELVSQVTLILDIPSKKPNYFRFAKRWQDALRLGDEGKLNEEAIKAVDKLKFLLKISEDKVAKLVGISRNSIRNWRNGQGAYPNTTSKLFQISHLIYALNSIMKQEQMLAWLNEPDNKNPSFSRLDILAQPDGPASVSQQASHILFPPPPSFLPSPDELRKELERIDLEEQGWMEYEEDPRQYSARPRRQRPAREFK